jgi:hypothetical protein
MLTIPLPKSALPALDTQQGFPAHINGEPVHLRLIFANEAGWLCYRDAGGFAHRCKVLTVTDDGEAVTFYAASHGEEDGAGGVFAVGEDGEVVDLAGTGGWGG